MMHCLLVFRKCAHKALFKFLRLLPSEVVRAYMNPNSRDRLVVTQQLQVGRVVVLHEFTWMDSYVKDDCLFFCIVA